MVDWMFDGKIFWLQSSLPEGPNLFGGKIYLEQHIVLAITTVNLKLV